MLVRWHEVPLDGWERKAVFLGFLDCEFPYLVVGANMALGSALEYWKAGGWSPYLATVYAMCRAANETPAFRRRIRQRQVIEHERIHADFTVPSGAESFTVKQVAWDPDFAHFYRMAQESNTATFLSPGSDTLDSDHWIFMSCLPWIQFTHVVQASDKKTATIPRLIWGRWFQEGGVWRLPLSVQVHHALVDGLHIARFMARVEALLADAAGTFGPLP